MINSRNCFRIWNTLVLGAWLLLGLLITTGCSPVSVVLQDPVPATEAVPAETPAEDTASPDGAVQTDEEGEPVLETITLAGGCFWCVEAVFQELKGVESVTSGFMGGRDENVTYEQVCSGETGHAEVAQIVFDPAQVDLSQVLEVFFRTHDPTTLNRQGADVGTQYRSAIFCHTEEQLETARQIKQRLEEEQVFDAPIVTEIVPADTFYPAEDYHQDYYSRNARQGYCQAVIVPKLEKFRKVFKDLLKEEK
jgi:methionine-S-sulfoxide reductase